MNIKNISGRETSSFSVNIYRRLGAGIPSPIELRFTVFSFFLLYLCIGTGLHSDDYSFLSMVSDEGYLETLSRVFSSRTFLYSAPAIAFDMAQFYLFRDVGVFYDLVKSFIAFFSAVSTWIYAKQFLTVNKAFVCSVLFVLFPLHDATIYWTTGTYLMLTGALIMLSHVYVNRGHFKTGLLLGLAGSFWSYASPPIFAGLCLPFFLRREYRKLIFFVAPQVAYVCYYFWLSAYFSIGEFRTPDLFSPGTVIKQFFVQICTLVDVVMGPSMWIKLYESLFSLTLPSFFASLIFIPFLLRANDGNNNKEEKMLLYSAIGVMLAALFVLSLTGGMPQIAFNLGNRVTYFCCFFIAVMSTLFIRNAISWLFVIVIFCGSVFGLADHWKEWNQRQDQVISNISTNSRLHDLEFGHTLLVTGNAYSQLGNMSHIEFFSSRYVVNGVFSVALGGKPDFQTINVGKHMRYKDGSILDLKNGERWEVGDFVNIYDSEIDRIIVLPTEEINAYISKLPINRRHWVQLFKGTAVETLITRLIPRLRYLFLP